MKFSSHRLHVVIEAPAGVEGDAVEYTIKTDMRDNITFDRLRAQLRLPAMEDAISTYFAVIAWSALRRSGETDLKWGEFTGVIMECEPLDDDGRELASTAAGDLAEHASEDVDPTPPAQTAG